MTTAPRDIWGFPESQRWVYLLLSACVTASFLIPTAWLADAPAVCAVRTTTGVSCPGCGLTRSFVATADGDLERAFQLHAFGPPLMMLFGLIVATRWLPRSSQRPFFPKGPMAHIAVRVIVSTWLVWAAARACGWLPGP